MILAPLILAGLLIRQSGGSQQGDHTTDIDGKMVHWDYPAKERPPYPAEVLNWKGWGFLPESGRVPVDHFRVLNLPKGLDGRSRPQRPLELAEPPVWHTKVVFFRESDILDTDESGVLRRRYSTLEPFEVDQIMSSVGRFVAFVDAYTGGAIQVQVDVETDNEPMRFDRTTGLVPWNADFAQDYFRPRLNGPGFVADDKAFRGPYQSVFYVHSGLTEASEAETVANGTPVTGLSIATDTMIPDNLSMDGALLLAWERQAHIMAQALGAPADFEPGPQDWALLAKAGNLNAKEQAALMTPHPGSPSVLATFPGLFSLAPTTSNVSVSIEKDPALGDVLSYTETGLYRKGGALAPQVKGAPIIVVQKTPYLSFDAKGVGSDPIAVTLYTHGSPHVDFVLGHRDAPRDAQEQPKEGRITVPLQFKADGTWQHVTINLLKYMPADSGQTLITALQIGPPLNAQQFPKVVVGKINYEFANFATSADLPGTLTPEVPPTQPDLTSTESEAKALGLAKLTSDSPRADLEGAVRLLADPDDLVKLNAAEAFSRVRYTASVPALSQAAHSINPRVSQVAIRALGKQDTEASWAVVRSALENGPLDADREEAARQIGSKKDAASAGPLSTVIDTRARWAKLAAIDALAGLPGEKTPMIALAFLGQVDPQVRLHAVVRANVANAAVRKQLLYTAVNDNSDAVRALSYLRLMESNDADARLEAYKGVRDDGELVRLAIVNSFAAAPKEEERQALHMATADASPRVRAASLRALAKLPNGVKIAEIQSTLSDPNPLVQDALLDLATSKAVTLPEAVLAGMRSSSVPRIAARAKGLP